MKLNVLLFASGLLGELTLKNLAAADYFPLVATNPPETMRKKPTGNIFHMADEFQIYETTGSKFSSLENNFPPADCAVTIDWTKDFFHDCPLPYPVYHLHPSLLPLYRGYGAISEQFLRGVKISGLTAYVENGRVDGGDIVYREKISIDYGDTPASFISKCAAACGRFIEKVGNGEEFKPMPQDEKRAFYLTRTRNRQTAIDFNASAYAVYNFIMAYSYPFSGAIFHHNGESLRAMLCAVEKWNGLYGEPGTILSITDYGIEIACGEGSVIISEIAKNGKYIHASLIDKEA